MENQITITSLVSEPDESTLEVTFAKYVDKSYMDFKSLLGGYKYLKVITFSYGLGFINEIAPLFEKIDIILGCEALVKYDVLEIAAFQKESLEMIRRHKYLVEQAAQGNIRFWFPHEIVSHQKIYILSNDDGSTRVINSSANCSKRGFTGNQREQYVCFDNDDLAYTEALNEFYFIQNFCTDDVINKTVYANMETEVTDADIPIFKESIAKTAGVIVEEAENKEEVEFITNISKLGRKYRQLNVTFNTKSGKTLLKADKVNELLRKAKEKYLEDEEKTKNFPLLTVDYETSELILNNKRLSKTSDIDKITNDIKSIIHLFDGYKSFIGYTPEQASKYYKAMTLMFLSPFIGNLRYEAHKNNYPTEFFPYCIMIQGLKSAGKSQFVDSIHQIMFGRSFKRTDSGSMTPGEYKATQEMAKGFPFHISDISKDRFSKLSILMKSDEYLLDEKMKEHPMFVFTSNDNPILKAPILKRVFFINVAMTQTNTTAVEKLKRMSDTRSKITTAFYTEYIRRITPEINNIINKMCERIITDEQYQWQPDVLALSSDIIHEILNDCGISIPEYFPNVTYQDFFGSEIIGEDAKNIIIRDWEHNPNLFKRNPKRNELVYNAGEQKYEAERIREWLPEILEAKISASKIIMKLDKAEEYFGIKFKRFPF